MKHTISVLVENRFGVLARVAGLFSARGYNIDSLTVSETEDPEISRMTIVVNAKDETILEQIKKQLNKLIDIITVCDFTKKEYLERELVFVRVAVSKKSAADLLKIAKRFGAVAVAKRADAVTFELAQDQAHVQRFVEALKDFKIEELVRSGRVAIAK
jgi:acetolactate synthase-1/3 small subunit